MRLIDADAFIQMMEEKCDPESTLDPWVLSVCRGGVKMMPTVDAVPVRHGRWVYTRSRLHKKCSECQRIYANGESVDNFCPSCGAAMRKDGGNGNTD